jgi:hypothetical protein
MQDADYFIWLRWYVKRFSISKNGNLKTQVVVFTAIRKNGLKKILKVFNDHKYYTNNANLNRILPKEMKFDNS